MKKLNLLFSSLAVAGALTLPLTNAMSELPPDFQTKQSPTMAPMLKHVMPSVVNIVVQKEPPANMLASVPNQQSPSGQRGFSPQQAAKMIAVGSGVVVDGHKGLIVTNAHVVKDSKEIIVTLKGGRKYRARLIGLDAGFDVALIKIEADNLPSIQFGNSDNLSVGDFVAAIGSPFGLSSSVSSGVVSGLNREQPKIEGYQSFIQTDAPINPGNSGGALVNMKGQLIGVNTAILTPIDASIGIGFAIPSNIVKLIIAQLEQYGKVERGMLGVIAQNISPELADAFHLKQSDDGVLVTQITPNSPAAKAHLQVKDVILRVNNMPIHSAAQLQNILGLTRPGTTIHLSILRNQKQEDVSALVADPKHILAAQAIPFLSGLRLEDFKELEPDGSNLKGAVIVGVNDNSDAALAGLITGDVITAANGQITGDVSQLESIAMGNPKSLLLKVSRTDKTIFLVINKSASLS